MDAKKIWSKAQDQIQKKKYDAALKTLEELKKLAPDCKEAYYLEAWIWHDLSRFLKEYQTLKKCLSVLDYSQYKDKDFNANILSQVISLGNQLAFYAEVEKFESLLIKMNQNKMLTPRALSIVISNKIFSEKSTVADFHVLYDEYKKYLKDIKPYPKKFFSHEKIRVGFLSSEFKIHPIINWAWSLLTKLDKKFFATYFYSNVKTPDKVTDYLRKTSDGWREIHDLTDEAAAKLIRDDEIDILFDLNGHTTSNRLRVAAYRPASVQVSGIGYMNSTGLDCFDYFLSDVFCAGNEKFFVEKVIKLPHSHICYEPPKKIEPADFPPYLKNNFVTFGSFSQFGKVTDSILIAWKKILDAVPDSKLILKHTIFNAEDKKNFVGERLKRLGFDLARIDMRPYTNTWLREYDDVDIALDTFPYTGGVTTCEALYMGVPVVSLYGERHGSRFGLSILSNVGLEELAVASYDEYINRAVMLASDWELLTLLRKNLRTMMEKSPLMDSANYLHEIQEAFIKILDAERKNFPSAKR